MTVATIKQLFIYPIKGLTPQEMSGFALTAGHGIKGDRTFALMFADNPELAQMPAENVPWKSKKSFAVQNDWPYLAALECDYQAETTILTVQRQGVAVLSAATNTAAGRDRISSFFSEYLAEMQPTKEARHPQFAPLRLVGDSSGLTRYPDREPVHISLLAQATLDKLTEKANQQIDVRRFRPNIVLEGISAWSEFDWIGKQFQLGTALIEVTARINRCVNIEVNPETGDRDIPLLSLLKQEFGHAQTGVLAKIINSGTVKIGDSLNL
ncbi:MULTISPECIES: MOSC domain-containing protein [Microcoleaceae]|uniref:MOSC domain-containing protein n=1 Tax=Microcoleaceae TaxID=1892252 RepID=UPI001882FBCC|nr:MOSC domain-containing protein [Tychonema sp. LEGE 06208]MBE9163206.1 MOSC domain-containing protein [Tychonema sp. LEGE 06208]